MILSCVDYVSRSRVLIIHIKSRSTVNSGESMTVDDAAALLRKTHRHGLDTTSTHVHTAKHVNTSPPYLGGYRW